MTLEEAQRQISDAWKTYSEQVERIAKATLRQEVWPVLKRRKYTLTSGMGTWTISNRVGQMVECTPSTRVCQKKRPDEELARIEAVLNCPIPGDPYNSLGTLYIDYPEPEERR